MSRWQTRVTRVALIGALLVALSGCGQPAYDDEILLPGFGASDVATIDTDTYVFADPTKVHHNVITDRQSIAAEVRYLTDIPVSARPAKLELQSGQMLDGRPYPLAQGLRFHLRDGGTFEITRVGFRPTWFVFPDGTIKVNSHGSPPLLEGDLVDPSERPAAPIDR